MTLKNWNERDVNMNWKCYKNRYEKRYENLTNKTNTIT